MMTLLVAPNSRQVFHGDTSGSNRFSKGHYSLRCEMAEFLRYGLFSSAQSFQQTISGASSYTSNPCSGLTEPKATMVQASTVNIQSLSCPRINSSQQILLAAVNPNNSTIGFGFRNINLNGQAQIPMTMGEFDFGIRPDKLRKAFAALVLDRCSPNAHSFGFGDVEVSLEADWNTLLVVDRQIPLSVGLHGSIGSDNMAEQRAGYLAGKLKLFTDDVVEFIGQSWGGRRFASIEDDLRDVIESQNVTRGYFEELGILRCDLQFVGSDGFHSFSLFHKTDENPLNIFEKGRQFLPEAEDLGVSLPQKI